MSIADTEQLFATGHCLFDGRPVRPVVDVVVTDDPVIGGCVSFKGLGDVCVPADVEGIDDVVKVGVGGGKRLDDATAFVRAVIVEDGQRTVAHGRIFRKNRLKRLLEKRRTVVGDENKCKERVLGHGNVGCVCRVNGFWRSGA